MEIRIRETGNIVNEQQFRELFPRVTLPAQLSDKVVNKRGGDIVHSGQPAKELKWWQHSARSGEEQIDGKWYAKHVAAPVFESQAEEDAYIAQKTAEKMAVVKARLTSAVQSRLDDFAATRNYSGIMSLCTYATSTVEKFALEGQCGVDKRDATWAKCYEILAEVEAGTRPIPDDIDDISAELPELEWPE